MVTGISRKSVTASLAGILLVLAAATPLGAKAAGQTLVQYDFDSERLEVGPDTFQLFQHREGTVSLSERNAFSGFRSLHIRDVVRDGTFPEFQGYFPEVSEGQVHIHFALMTPTPEEPFNVAWAGKGHYRLQKHGVNFWLLNDGKILRHRSDGIPKKLFPLSSYMWYLVDVTLHIDAGTYDLRIRNEDGVALAELYDQPNATAQQGSSVNQYSFIGDLEDQHNADIYIDELRVSASEHRASPEFVAPGRRKLFVERWDDYHQSLYGKLQCLPAVDLHDFGITRDVAHGLSEKMDLLAELIGGHSSLPPAGESRGNAILSAVEEWVTGCRALKQTHAGDALGHFDKAISLAGDGPIYVLSRALAYAAQGKYAIAVTELINGQSNWPEDMRWRIARAMVALHQQRDASAEHVLQRFANRQSDYFDKPELRGLIEDGVNRNTIAALKRFDQEHWGAYLEHEVAAEQYYFSLLWQEKYSQAQRYAAAMASRIEALDVAPLAWWERVADAALFDGRPRIAEGLYRQVLQHAPRRTSSALKLSDAYFLLGDKVKEREMRRSVYGAFSKD